MSVFKVYPQTRSATIFSPSADLEGPEADRPAHMSDDDDDDDGMEGSASMGSASVYM